MINIFIKPSGDIEYLSDDRALSLVALGDSEIKRVSNIVAKMLHGKVAYYVDLRLVCKTVLGPFSSRSEAIAQEREKINNLMRSEK
jgi:hypothetical protein